MAHPHEFLKSRFPDDLGEFKGVDISVVDDGKDVDCGTPKREKIRGKSIDLYTALYMCLERNDALNRKFHVEFKEAGAVPEKWLKLDEDTERDEVLNTDKTMSLRVVITESKCVFSHTSFLSSGSDGTFKKLQQAAAAGSSKPQHFQIHSPQKDCLLQLRKSLADAEDGARFLSILPTGSGKTLLMALSPFMLDVNKVLVILPNISIREQVFSQICNYYKGGSEPSAAL